MKKISILFSVALALSVWHAAAEAPLYTMNLKIDPEAGLITGSFEIEAHPAPGAAELFLGLDLNSGEKPNPKETRLAQSNGPDGFIPSRATVTNLSVGGAARGTEYLSLASRGYTTYNLDRQVLRVPIPSASAGGTVTIAFDYEARLSNMATMDDTHYSDFFVSRFSWLPHLLSDEAEARGSLQAPFRYEATVELARPGWELLPEGLEFERASPTRYAIKADRPLASLPLVCVKGHRTYELPIEAGSKTIRVSYLPGCEEQARALATYAADALAYYRQTYFALDYPVLNVVEGLPGCYGFGADGTVILGRGLFDGNDLVAPHLLDRLPIYVLSHELGHFYFGISGPPDFSKDNWLSEGLNEYSTMRFIEARYGTWMNLVNTDAQDILVKLLNSDFTSLVISSSSWRSKKWASIRAQAINGQVNPLSHEAGEVVANQTSVTDYDRAEMIVESLESYAGKDRFIEALVAYLRETRGQATSAAIFEKSLESTYGRDLSAFFAAYVYGTAGMDYSIASAKLNQKGEGGWSQKATIDFKGSGPFVPTTLRAYLEDGRTTDLAVEAPGEVAMLTQARANFLLVDPDFRSIDYDRAKNAFPQPVLIKDDKTVGLVETGAATGLSLDALILSTIDGTYIGGAAAVGRAGSWSLAAGPALSPNSNTLGGYDVCGVASLSLAVAGGLSGGLHQAYDLNERTAALGGSLSWSPYLNSDVGYKGRYFRQPLTIAEAASLMNLSSADPNNAAFANSASVSYTDLLKLGIFSSASLASEMTLGDLSWQHRAKASLDYCLPVYKRLMLALDAGGSYSFGRLSALGASNAVLGLSNSAGGDRIWGAAWGTFLGFPLGERFDLPIFNTLTMTNLLAGLEYRGASAFNSGDQFVSGSRQALGISFIPVFRSLIDALNQPLYSFGMCVDLGAIASKPADPASYRPSFYLGVTLTVPLYYGQLFSY